MEFNRDRGVIIILIIGDEFDKILLINKIHLEREIIYKDFNSGLIIYKEAVILSGGIYKGYFITYKRVFINIFNKGLIIIAGKNIAGNKVFGNIYNKRLIIIMGRRLRGGFINNNILIFFLIIIKGFI